MEDDQINAKMWALPVFEYVEGFNARTRDIQIVCDPATIMQYIHLHFRPTEKIVDLLSNVLFVAITHSAAGYHLSGHFTIKPVDWLNADANKLQSRGIAQRLLATPFCELDEKERGVSRYVTPPHVPALVHRYGDHEMRDEFEGSEIYFRPIMVTDFSMNPLERYLNDFQSASTHAFE